MRTARGLMAGCAVVAAIALALSASAARADFSTERPGSILIFPKVVNSPEDARNTVIQITNTSNLTRYAHCFYVNGAPENPYLPPDPELNPPLCSITDFELTLTKQQPTHWLASQGRPVDPTDEIAGLDPGTVPPAPPAFTGELVCVEVDESGNPMASNPFKGEATIGDTAGVDVTKYNATAVKGIDPDSDLDLKLDNREYNACPEGLILNFQAEGGADAVIDALGSGSSQVNTALALVPCSADFDNLIAGRVTLQFGVHNEFEEYRSASTTITCWQSLSLDDSLLNGAFTPNVLGTMYGTANITPVDAGGVVGVASTRRIDTMTGASGTADVNLHVEGNNPSTNTDSVIRVRGF
jgi:hypothetical protein